MKHAQQTKQEFGDAQGSVQSSFRSVWQEAKLTQRRGALKKAKRKGPKMYNFRIKAVDLRKYLYLFPGRQQKTGTLFPIFVLSTPTSCRL